MSTLPITPSRAPLSPTMSACAAVGRVALQTFVLGLVRGLARERER